MSSEQTPVEHTPARTLVGMDCHHLAASIPTKEPECSQGAAALITYLPVITLCRHVGAAGLESW